MTNVTTLKYFKFNKYQDESRRCSHQFDGRLNFMICINKLFDGVSFFLLSVIQNFT